MKPSPTQLATEKWVRRMQEAYQELRGVRFDVTMDPHDPEAFARWHAGK